MEFSDYIYVIIGVLWFLFSIIGGAMKAKNKQKLAQSKTGSTTNTSTEPTQDLRKMLEDLMAGKTTEVIKEVAKPLAVKKPAFVAKKAPSKLDVHKEHQSFMIDERKKKKKTLQNQKEELSSYSESSPFTTSLHQHPPDVIPAEQVSEFAHHFKDVSIQKHPILEDFDGQKAFIFAEIFNRRSY